MPVTKTEAVAYFLRASTHADLAALYTPAMEVQVSVAQDGGERVQGEYKGRTFTRYTDGLHEWYNFRIPRNAATEPVDNDGVMDYALAAHAEAIGLTGWDYKARASRWVGFDFDAISGHAEAHRAKLTDEELAVVRRKAMEIPWVTVRKSTGGRGLHLYVFLPEVATANHTEHAALARAVLGKMSARVGYDFRAKVDACGAVLWVYHRKMIGTDGLTLVKQGETLLDIPPDWRTPLPIRRAPRPGAMPRVHGAGGGRDDRDRLFDEMTGRSDVPLDAGHQKLLDWLAEAATPSTWEPAEHRLRTHTFWLKQAHAALALRGPFETVSTGRDRAGDINAFARPLPDGAWVVYRYGHGVAEAPTWSTNRNGWTWCYLNRGSERHAPHGSGRRGGFSFNVPL